MTLVEQLGLTKVESQYLNRLHRIVKNNPNWYILFNTYNSIGTEEARDKWMDKGVPYRTQNVLIELVREWSALQQEQTQQSLEEYVQSDKRRAAIVTREIEIEREESEEDFK